MQTKAKAISHEICPEPSPERTAGTGLRKSTHPGWRGTEASWLSASTILHVALDPALYSPVALSSLMAPGLRTVLRFPGPVSACPRSGLLTRTSFISKSGPSATSFQPFPWPFTTAGTLLATPSLLPGRCLLCLTGCSQTHRSPLPTAAASSSFLCHGICHRLQAAA